MGRKQVELQGGDLPVIAFHPEGTCATRNTRGRTEFFPAKYRIPYKVFSRRLLLLAVN